MEVSVTQEEGLERRMTVAVPPELIEQKIRDRLTSLAGSVKLDGFRPGKIPYREVERRFGSQVRQEVSQDIVKNSFQVAITQQQLRLAGDPKIEATQIEPGKALEYTATFEIYPVIEFNLPEHVQLEKIVYEITNDDVDLVIERIQKQHLNWVPIDEEAQEGNQVKMDFSGSLDGEKFDGGEADGIVVVLGSKTLVGEFEENLIGVKAGELRNFDVTFPDNYPAEKIAGKIAHFDVKVHSVCESVLPEVDDEFAIKFGIKEGGVAIFRERLRENIQREAEQAVNAELKSKVVDILLDSTVAELPRILVENEITARQHKMKAQLLQQGVPEKEITLERSSFNEAAQKSVKLGLVLSDIVKQQDYAVSAAEVRKGVENQAVSYERPEEVIQWYYADKSRLNSLEALILENKAIDWVVSQADISEKSKPIAELLPV